MDLPKLGLGRTTLTITDNTGTPAASGTYEPLKSGVIISLTVGEKITPNAAIVLGRAFTLDEVNALWEEFGSRTKRPTSSSPAKIRRRCATWRFMDRGCRALRFRRCPAPPFRRISSSPCRRATRSRCPITCAHGSRSSPPAS